MSAESQRWKTQQRLLDVDSRTGIDRRVLTIIGDTPAQARRVKRPDGAIIAYKKFGNAPRTIVFCNGLGGTYRTFADIFPQLLKNFQIITFDYRGLFESGDVKARDPLTVREHALDLLAVMDDAGVDSAVLFGWSMGVQVAFDVVSFAQHRVQGLICASGTDGKTLETLAFFPKTEKLTLPAVKFLQGTGGPIFSLLSRTCESAPLRKTATTLGLVGRNAEVSLRHAALMLSSNPRVFFKIAEQLNIHEVEINLEQLHLPVLIFHGDADVFVPVLRSAELRTRIPDAELWVFGGCTHAVILEYPERVARRVVDFLARRFAPT